MSAPRFDRYVAVDWSASATPKTGADSIWIADQARDGEPTLTNPSTRRAAADALAAIVDAADSERILVGVDAALGYPVGTAQVFGVEGDPWRSTWRAVAELVTDHDGNGNNRFDAAAELNRRAGPGEGPFWGCPNDDHAPTLRRTKPARFPVDEFRSVERSLRSVGRYPKSAWQLLGVGSVGSQTLTLLPVLYDLLDQVAVWPFTTGLDDDPAARVVIAEIWPSMFVESIPAGMVADAAQVAGTADAMLAADIDGVLTSWLRPEVADADAVCCEEGWILGVDPVTDGTVPAIR